MQKFFQWTCLVFIFFTTYVHSTEEEAIKEVTASYVEAFNKKNAKAMAEHWAQDGQYVSPITKETVVGREAIEEELQDLMELKGEAQVAIDVDSVAFPEEGKAIETGKATLKLAEGSSQETLFRVTFLWQDNQWNIQKIDEVEWVEAPSLYQHLQDLEWLIGDWVDQGDAFEIASSYRWDKNKNFLTNHFSVNALGKLDLEGEQIIGWDANKEEIRSWMFDSDGGIAEAKWKKEDKAWIVKSTSLLPSGKKGSQVIILTPGDRNSYTLEITDREVDGEMLPNIDPVKIIRKSGGV